MGCTGSATKAAGHAQTPDALAEAFMQAIQEQGYSLGQADESPDDSSVLYDLYSDAFSDNTSACFMIQSVDQTIQAVGFELYHPKNESADLNAGLALAQSLLQVCDPSIAGNGDAAAKRLTEIFQSSMQGKKLEKNGYHYMAFGTKSNIMKLIIEYPGYSEEEASKKELTLLGTKALGFTEEGIVASYEALTAKYQIRVTPIKQSMATIPDLARLPTEGSPKVYALEHGLGITVGWLVFYSSDAGLVQLNFVERNDGGLQLYLIQLDLADALVQACDPVFSLEDTKENQDQAHDIASEFCLLDPITANGIQYLEHFDDGYLFVSVTKE